MDLQKITDMNQLKAMAYDQLANRELADRNLQAINARIQEVDAMDKNPDGTVAKPKK